MKKWMKILISIIAVASFTALGYYAGYQTAKRSMPEPSSVLSWMETTTFYAEIKAVNDSNFLVEGLSINDINYRGEFWCYVEENTLLLWRGTELEFSDFEVGDLVSITFSGVVLEIYPGIPTNILSIQLLDDEK